MTELEIFKPGAKAGQVILCVNLSTAGDIGTSLSTLKVLGYEQPEFRHITVKSGIQVFAVLKDETHQKGVPFDYLMPEWNTLMEHFEASSVHLWRGYSNLQSARIGGKTVEV
ncbi:MAG TPA: hypothetical protein V6D33_09030 [Cyanophyceae cyanobacterium]